MKKNVLTIAAVLGASFALCQAHLFSKDKDAFIELSDYLQNCTSSMNYEDNVKLVKEFIEAEDFAQKDATLRQLAKLIVNLDPRDKCTAENIEMLKAAVETAYMKPKGAFVRLDHKHHLSKLLNKYIEEAKGCFNVFEETWRIKRTTSEFWENIDTDLFRLDGSVSWRLGTYYKGKSKSMKLFDQALRRMESDQIVSLMTGLLSCKIKNVLLSFHHKITGSNDLDRAYPGAPLKKLTKKETEEYLDKFLWEPCDNLMRSKAARRIFKPVVNLGTIVKIDDSIKGYENYETMTWASRYIACDLLLDMNKEELAKKVPNIWFSC